MGYASRNRGTFAERKAKAIERDEAIRAERERKMGIEEQRKQAKFDAHPVDERARIIHGRAMLSGMMAMALSGMNVKYKVF